MPMRLLTKQALVRRSDSLACKQHRVSYERRESNVGRLEVIRDAGLSLCCSSTRMCSTPDGTASARETVTKQEGARFNLRSLRCHRATIPCQACDSRIFKSKIYLFIAWLGRAFRYLYRLPIIAQFFLLFLPLLGPCSG